MRQGENILYLARKEQCLALGGQQLRQKKINDYKIYRIFPDGETILLHPKDGVFPEKVNEGRPYVNKVERSIGQNPSPAKVKFSTTKTYDPDAPAYSKPQ
jgi:photosystem I subunit 2